MRFNTKQRESTLTNGNVIDTMHGPMNRRSSVIGHAKIHYVYALLDALDIEVYIGQTNNPQTRLSTHHSRPCGWPMREAVMHGVRFRMRILSEHRSEPEAQDEERRQIAARVATGQMLLNVVQNERNNPRGPITRWTPTSRWWHQQWEESGRPGRMWE